MRREGKVRRSVVGGIQEISWRLYDGTMGGDIILGTLILKLDYSV